MKKLLRKIIVWGVSIAVISDLFPIITPVEAAVFLAGRILLQVESRGEAWYVNPSTGRRYFLGSPSDAWQLFRSQGTGISDDDLDRIPIGEIGSSTKMTSNAFAAKNAGKIFLQVQAKGEAWYINPVDNHRYYLGQPRDVLQVMRALGLGISNDNLKKIPSASSEYSLDAMEKDIQELVSDEREKAGLGRLKWNDELAAVAREHSQDLALEDEPLTGENLTCEFPLIHHEGMTFGLYHSDRLNNRGVYYFSKSAENIALIPVVKKTFIYKSSQTDTIEPLIGSCNEKQKGFNDDLKEKTENKDFTGEQKVAFIKADIEDREKAIQKELSVEVKELAWDDQKEAEKETVTGWMNSPGHRANIMRADYDEAGVGITTVGGYIIATQVFIQRTDCGFKGGTCCQKAGYYPYCFVPLECGSNSVCK